jgi:hypothetical protein
LAASKASADSTRAAFVLGEVGTSSTSAGGEYHSLLIVHTYLKFLYNSAAYASKKKSSDNDQFSKPFENNISFINSQIRYCIDSGTEPDFVLHIESNSASPASWPIAQATS